MGRLVDTDDLEKGLKALMRRNGIKSWLSTAYDACDIETLIDDAPTVDAEPVRHGRWNIIDDGRGGELLECSNCRYTFRRLFPRHYCPNCGAKMDAEESNANK